MVVAAAVGGGLVLLLLLGWKRARKPVSMVDVLSQSRNKTIQDMVEQLLKLKVITHDKVAKTMLAVDRVNFVPEGHPTPYKEAAVPIGYHATLSAPHMHAIGLDLLAPYLTPGASVLDVGSGSGYMSACMANMVQPTGRVFGIDHVKELVDQSIVNITNSNPNLLALINLEVGDGFQGSASHGPFDVIYVGAASQFIPEALVDQMKPGGRMVIPIGPPDGFHSLVVVDKNKDGAVSTKNMGTVRFVPLTTYEKQIEGGEIGMTKVVFGEEGENLLVRTQYYAAPDTTPAEIKILKAQMGH